jgi:hypothetical protein
MLGVQRLGDNSHVVSGQKFLHRPSRMNKSTIMVKKPVPRKLGNVVNRLFAWELTFLAFFECSNAVALFYGHTQKYYFLTQCTSLFKFQYVIFHSSPKLHHH